MILDVDVDELAEGLDGKDQLVALTGNTSISFYNLFIRIKPTFNCAVQSSIK